MQDHTVGINKSSLYSMIIPALKIIQPRLFIIGIATIAERIQLADCRGERTGDEKESTPSIVLVFYNERTRVVKDADDVTLEVVDITVGGAIEHNDGRAILSIIEEVQIVAAVAQVYNILAVQGVVRGAGSGADFLYAQAVSIVGEGSSFTALHYLL